MAPTPKSAARRVKPSEENPIELVGEGRLSDAALDAIVELLLDIDAAELSKEQAPAA